MFSTYFVSSALAAAAYRLDRLDTEPCALRVLADANEFDKEYVAHLEDVTGAAIAGEPVPADGSSLFLRVFDDDAGTVEADDATWDVTGQAPRRALTAPGFLYGVARAR